MRAASSDDYCSYMDMAALWEYFTVEVGTNDGSLVPRMNQLGSLGWEAVGVTGVDRTLGMNRVMVLMKRAILPKPPPVGDISVGWKPDPFGRFSMRWWDGIRWTEHVINNDEKPTLDPPVG